MAARAIMVQGTTSNAGKSLTAAGLCRIFAQDGYKVAPFKSQNMALNSYITHEGLEMGRAQVMQAEAAGIEPSVIMNPILLKPTNDTGSQVIVCGEVLGNKGAEAYYQYKHELRPVVEKCYAELAAQYDIVVIEGAGSPAEINLNDGDFVNMGMAKIADAPVLLVGDIDRGGVFASLYGTIELLQPDEKPYVKGTIINKFRGDLEILRPGLKMLEDLTHVPVLGVVPYLHLDIDDEDSLTERIKGQGAVKPIDIVVIGLPHISNFTDFNAVSRSEAVGLRYVRRVGDIGNPDLVIVPGTKNTMGDLKWMRESGIEGAVKHLASQGTPVIGVCGGYQMLGMTLSDPDGIEEGGDMRGMELLACDTVFEQQKVRTRITGHVLDSAAPFEQLSGAEFDGYEIHMGRTTLRDGAKPFIELEGGVKAGAISNNVCGSYIHGIFDDEVGERVVSMLLDAKGIETDASQAISSREYKEQQYDALAAALRESLDMKAIYDIIGLPGPKAKD